MDNEFFLKILLLDPTQLNPTHGWARHRYISSLPLPFKIVNCERFQRQRWVIVCRSRRKEEEVEAMLRRRNLENQQLGMRQQPLKLRHQRTQVAQCQLPLHQDLQ